MKLHWYAKIFGWLQFAVQAIPQLMPSQPHGLLSWLQIIGAGAVAVAIHASSSTDGTK